MILSIIDVVVLLFILFGAISGFKRGVIKSAVDFIGTLLVIIVAFYLKNPLSVLMYTNLPFFNFGGIFAGITVINILVYELIAYIIVLLVLFSILKVIIKISGLIEKILKATIILGIPSKILGMIFGAIEAYLFVFIVLFIVNQIPNTTNLMVESKTGKAILENTPILSGIMSEGFETLDEIYDVANEYKNNSSDKEANKKAFDIILKNKIITTKNAEKLVEKKRIDVENAEEIINKYKAEENMNKYIK